MGDDQISGSEILTGYGKERCSPTQPSPTRGEGDGGACGADGAVACTSPRPSPQGGEGDGKAFAELNAQHSRPVSVLPRGFGWLRKLLPVSAGLLMGEVESLLANF